MFTVVKNKLADVPTSHENHASHDELNVTLPRFDKVIKTLNESRRRQAHSQVKMPPRRIRSFFETTDFKIGSRHR